MISLNLHRGRVFDENCVLRRDPFTDMKEIMTQLTELNQPLEKRELVDEFLGSHCLWVTR
jgi:hypothetical protein